jgi:hypothetical protein
MFDMSAIDDKTMAGDDTMKVMRTMVWDFVQTATLAPPDASLLLTWAAWLTLRLAATQSECKFGTPCCCRRAAMVEL